MHKRKDKFSELIYGYCDDHIGEEVLSLVFVNLYPIYGKRNKTSLARYTSKIVNELVLGGFLKEIKNDSNPKPPERNTPHGIYKILEHEPLMEIKNNFKDVYNFDFTQGPL